MMMDNEIDMVARGNTMEDLKAFAPAVEFALPGELTIRDDYDEAHGAKFVNNSPRLLNMPRW